ncbi:MAG: hypothetical protein JSV52_14050 [Candidatus Zixiibacteriota bacterium]|nr:MAG: hypothetical protein JSV52_14050 [candidate division Zixibacteria bacterium]
MGSRITLVVVLLLILAGNSAATTYYVSKNGAGTDGRSWQTAWTTIDDVNVGVSSGDTVFFGTGTWIGTQLRCVAGTYSDRTVYACSSFAYTNFNGEYHFAKIWGASSLDNANKNVIQCHYDNNSRLSYVTLYGLELAYGRPRVISIYGVTVDSFFVDHCKLVGCISSSYDNPSLWHSGTMVGSEGSFNRLLACSLSTAYGPGGGHGCGIDTYSQNNMTVDSCVFYGHFDGACLWWKNDNDGENFSNVVKNSLFTPTSADYGGGVWLYRNQNYDSVYNNVFAGGLTRGVRIGNHTSRPNNSTVIQNNTFINCAGHGGDRNCIDGYATTGTVFKYNVVYRTSTPYHVIGECLDQNDLDIDSNLYVVASANAEYGYANYVSQSFWMNTLGHDRNSAFYSNVVDIGFADINNGDYRRSPDTIEMNAVYDGRQWLYYGANLFPGEIDSIAPSPIDDLGAVPGEVDGEIILTWTAPGNDGDEGTLFRYEVMWSETPITEDNWTASMYIYNPRPAGNTERYVISDLRPGVDYYVAVRGFDFVSNETGISNIVQACACAVRPPPWLFTRVNELDGSAILTCSTVVSYRDADIYRFALTDSASDNTVIESVSATGDPTLSVTFTDLDPGSLYYWRCRTVVTGADSSDWSFPKKFRLSNVCPDPPDIIYPAESETVLGAGSDFGLMIDSGTDDDSTGQLSYDFELSRLDSSTPLAAATGVVGDESPMSWTVPVFLEGNTTYRWRVRSFDGLDYSFWSDWSRFTLTGAIAGDTPDDPNAVIAFPNPVHFNEGEYVTFTLPDDPVDLLIQTVSGETVLMRTGISGDWQWFGENASGNIVAIGIYSWFVRGTSQSGKIVVKP